MTMNPEVKTLWLKALRSGEYEQGQGFLNRRGKFCCLGVLCDLAVRSGVEVEVEVYPFASEHLYDGDGSTLPESVKVWAGLNSYDPQLGENTCIALNDGDEYVERHEFSEIADLIEEHL